jgi:DNA-directed RNA polymerase sigma subunit (sigma70/sigma32)
VAGGGLAWARDNLTVEPDLEEALDDHRELARLDAALEALPARHRFILQGLREGRTSEAIAADLGLSRQRVDQIRVDAMRGLRVQLGLDDEDEEDDEDPEPVRSPRRRLAATLTP